MLTIMMVGGILRNLVIYIEIFVDRVVIHRRNITPSHTDDPDIHDIRHSDLLTTGAKPM